MLNSNINTLPILKWFGVTTNGDVLLCKKPPKNVPVSLALPNLPEKIKEQLPKKFGAPNKNTNFYSIESIKKITDFLGLNVIPAGGSSCKFSLETAVFVTMKILISQKYDRESYDLIQLIEEEYRKHVDSRNQYSKGWGAFREAFKRYLKEINTALAAVVHLYNYYNCGSSCFLFNYAALQKQCHSSAKIFVSDNPDIKRVFYAFAPESSLPKQKQAKSFENLMSDKYRRYLCESFHVTQRERKFNLKNYIISSLLTRSKDSGENSCSSIADIFRLYRTLQEDNANISRQAFHIAIEKNEMLLVIQEITAQMMLLADKQSLNDGYGHEIKKILSSLNLSRVRVIDGTVINVVNHSENNFPCRATNASKRTIHSCEDRRKKKYRNTKLEAHFLYDVERGCCSSFILTEGITDERHILQCFIPYIKKQDTLLLADRGYDSSKIFNELNKNNICFIIRISVKHTIVIKQILSSSNEKVTPKFIQIGQALTLEDRNLKNEIQAHGALKLEITMNGVSLFLYASFKHNISSSDASKNRPMYLASNLDIELNGIMSLYRLRWVIERFFFY